MDLASAHVKAWRLRLSVELSWDQEEEEQPEAAPIGFAPAAIESPELEEEDGGEDNRVGFV